MIVHDMDPPDLYPYKGPQMKKIFKAFREMLQSRALAGPVRDGASATPAVREMAGDVLAAG
jgi:hypothetical protein